MAVSVRAVDTIYALSSGNLPSGVAVIRLSGPAVPQVLRECSGGLPEPRRAALRSIRDRNGEIVDKGLVLYFPAPASFTGEDCIELQVHGGRAVVNAILNVLASFSELRHAEAGEFSRRAFHNGKLDLVEVEGLADLISAETEMQRRLALEHSSGRLSTVYQNWAKRLTHARAMIEAELDFSDEDDIPGSLSKTIWADLSALQSEITFHVEGAATAEIIRDGLKIVIAGPPNAGKSSLLNYLADRDIAIVTDIPGTTRDTIQVDLSLAGFTVRFFDTAGLRSTEDLVEREGIRRTYVTLGQADIVLLLSESPDGFSTLAEGDFKGDVIRVATKIDRADAAWAGTEAEFYISTRSGVGIETLVTAVTKRLPDMANASAFALPTRRHHLDCLRQTADALSNALRIWQTDQIEVQAELLRHAADALGRITGRVDVENLLDVIFSEFCVGK